MRVTVILKPKIFYKNELMRDQINIAILNNIKFGFLLITPGFLHQKTWFL